MNNKSFNVFIATYMAILIPLPGRFVFGITLLIELLLLAIVGTLINSLINLLNLKEIKSFLIVLTLFAFSILLRQILVLAYPEIALTLGYFIYLPTASLLLYHFLFANPMDSLKDRLLDNIIKISIFSISGVLFSLLRDIAGYGTFTFFGKNHQIFEKVLFNRQGAGIFSFIASIPGALVIAGIFLFAQLVLKNRIRILKNAEVNNDLH